MGRGENKHICSQQKLSDGFISADGTERSLSTLPPRGIQTPSFHPVSRTSAFPSAAFNRWQLAQTLIPSSQLIAACRLSTQRRFVVSRLSETSYANTCFAAG